MKKISDTVFGFILALVVASAISLMLLAKPANAQVNIGVSQVINADFCVSTVSLLMPDVATTTNSAYRLLNRKFVAFQNPSSYDCGLRFDGSLATTNLASLRLPSNTTTPLVLYFGHSVPVRMICNGTTTRPNCPTVLQGR